MFEFPVNAVRESKAFIYLNDESQGCLAHMLSILNEIRFPPGDFLEPDFPNKPPGYCLSNLIIQNKMLSTLSNKAHHNVW